MSQNAPPTSFGDTNALTRRILIGLVAGMITGLGLNSLEMAWPETGIYSFLVEGVFHVGGQIFLSSLRLLVVPLVLVSLVCGTAALEDVTKLGRIGGKTLALYLIATREGRTSVATMLLAGVALGALAGSLTGLLAFISDDRQLRDLTFWSMGSLGGASWTKLSAIAPIIIPLLLAMPLLARGLNGLMLGEAEAYHLGIPVQRIKAMAILLVALAVGASVAAAGLIGFVGIVVPHLVRLAVGPDHRLLLPLSALGGAILLVGADIVARLVVAPAELPIGIVTAAIGAPFFLWLLLRRSGSLDG